MFNVQNPPRQQHVALDGASHSVYAKGMLAARHGVESKARLVVDCVLRWSIGGICRHVAINQRSALSISCASRNAGGVSQQGIAAALDQGARQVCQGLGTKFRRYGHDGQHSVIQRTDSLWVHAFPTGRSLGAAEYALLEKANCPTKIRSSERLSRRLTANDGTKAISRQSKSEAQKTETKNERNGSDTRKRFHARAAAFSIQQSLIFTTLIRHRQSATSLGLLAMERMRWHWKRLRSALPCAATATASCIMTSA